MNNPEYKDAFFMYFNMVGRNKRYANIYKKRWKSLKKIWQYQNNSLTLHPNKKTKWKTLQH